MDLAEVTSECFSPYKGNSFRVFQKGVELTVVELISVKQFDNHADNRFKRIPFCLTFRGAKSPIFPQNTYRFEHAELGGFEVFAVPVGPDKVGMQYEVQFS